MKGEDKAFARATVSFAAPLDLAGLKADEAVTIDLRVTGYALGALQPGGPVPHAHLIVDNEPALEIDDASAPLVLRGLPRGPHLLRAVLCRPWHEVVKAPRAFALARFWIGPKLEGKSGRAAEYVAWPDPSKPLVTYVLPIGEPSRDAPALVLELKQPVGEHGPASAFLGDAAREEADAGVPVEASKRAERPVLDFYLSNAKLARRGDKLRLVLDRRELPLVTEWKPQHLRRARPGAHKITIDLLNRRGLKVKNAVNRTDRSFTAAK